MSEDNQNIKQRAKKGVYWSTFSNVTNQGTQFVIGIILARLLSPEDYGIIALPTIFLAVAQCFIDSGFSSALVRKEEVTEDDLTTAFYFNIGVGIFFYTILFFCSPLIADFYNTPILSDILKVTALGLLFGPLQSVHFALFSRKLDFKTPSLISVSSKFVTGAAGIAMAFMGFGIWALVFQGIAGSLLSLTIVWARSDWRPRGKWSKESFNYLWGFGSKLLSSSILDTLYNNIIPVFLGKWCSPRDLGLFNRGYGYAALPFNQLNGFIGPLTFPVFSRIQNDEQQLYNYFRKILRLLIFVLAPLELLLVVLSKPLILFLLTDKWEECIIVTQIMSISIILWPLQGLNMSLFSAKGRSDLVLKANVGVKIFGVVTLLASLPFGLIIICATGIFRSLTNIAWVTHYTGKISDFGMIQQFKEILPSLLLATSMAITNYFLINLFENYVVQIIVGGLYGVTFYVGSAYFMKYQELNYLIELIKKRRTK